MIYTVEQCINEPVSDAEWKQWASEMKPVPVLMAVQGFTAAQRFKGINDPLSPSIAVYSVVSPDVLNSEDYFRNAKGGNLGSPRWKPRLKYWLRNLFAGLDQQPAVPLDSVLVVLDAERPGATLGDVRFTWLECVGLDRSTLCRGIAVLPQEQAEPWFKDTRPGLQLYRPYAEISVKP